ncbi:hypothetical protein KKC97_05660 [bacterium]|nr:hypothetical protein [bacterium]MBU1637136.1 hypothetical protein [bacterium]MBU1920916.1 hypothetical protein [bacterium]
MAHSSLTMPGSLYRPKKLPRVIRRQTTVIRLTGVVLLIGLAGFAVAWKNILHERLALDIARQRSAITLLNQEIAQLEGTLESAAAYPRISAWAEKRYHWKPIKGRVHEINIPQSLLSERAMTEAQIAGELNEQ